VIVTTVRIERPQGTVIASGVPVQIDQASLEERVEFDGARPYDVFMVYTLWPPLSPAIIQRRDTLVDEQNTDAETGQPARYRVSGLVETFDGDHQEALIERVVGN
jgi:hypothetical protein